MATIHLLRKAGLLVDELAKSEATPADLAKALDEPRSSIYRIVASLEKSGYVRQVGDGRLELGAAILRLGDCSASALVDRFGLREQLKWVKSQLGAAAFFSVFRNGKVICLDQVEGSDVDLLYLVPGRSLPTHAGAASHVLVAYSNIKDDCEGNDAALSKTELSQNAMLNPELSSQLVDKCAQAFQQGWSVDDGELAEGVATVAVPVITDAGDLFGAVAVAGLRTNLLSHISTAREVLVTAANRITALQVVSGNRCETGKAEMANELVAAKRSSVISKAAALMSVLESEKLASPTRIGELLDEPVSSVYRMLSTLSELGWVEQGESRGPYRIGLKMLSLSEGVLRRMDIRKIAAPTLKHIHEVTGETTFLCIRHGGRAVCIERIDGIRVNSRVLQLGKSLPLHVGAAPRALLAFDTRAAWEDYALAVDATGDGWRRGASKAELFRALEQEREQGYVLSDNNVTPGIAAVGAPIYNHRGEVVASLSLSGLREGVIPHAGQTQSMIDLICSGAEQISSTLGSPTVKNTGLC